MGEDRDKTQCLAPRAVKDAEPALETSLLTVWSRLSLDPGGIHPAKPRRASRLKPRRHLVWFPGDNARIVHAGTLRRCLSIKANRSLFRSS